MSNPLFSPLSDSSIIIESVNQLLSDNIDINCKAIIKQKDILDFVQTKTNSTTEELINNGFLGFVHNFTKNGWNVEFIELKDDNESYYIFTEKE